MAGFVVQTQIYTVCFPVRKRSLDRRGPQPARAQCAWADSGRRRSDGILLTGLSPMKIYILRSVLCTLFLFRKGQTKTACRIVPRIYTTGKKPKKNPHQTNKKQKQKTSRCTVIQVKLNTYTPEINESKYIQMMFPCILLTKIVERNHASMRLPPFIFGRNFEPQCSLRGKCS